jgi:hypothetical protein
MGGFSGAPVFVRESIEVPNVVVGGEPIRTHAYGRIYLLGIMHGHWDLARAQSVNESLPEAEPHSGVNMGIAIVTPIDRVEELLESDTLREQRRAIIAERRRLHSERAAHATQERAVRSPQNSAAPPKS